MQLSEDSIQRLAEIAMGVAERHGYTAGALMVFQEGFKEGIRTALKELRK